MKQICFTLFAVFVLAGCDRHEPPMPTKSTSGSVVAQPDKNISLTEARRGFKTKVIPQPTDKDTVPVPPPGIFFRYRPVRCSSGERSPSMLKSASVMMNISRPSVRLAASFFRPSSSWFRLLCRNVKRRHCDRRSPSRMQAWFSSAPATQSVVVVRAIVKRGKRRHAGRRDCPSLTSFPFQPFPSCESARVGQGDRICGFPRGPVLS